MFEIDRPSSLALRQALEKLGPKDGPRAFAKAVLPEIKSEVRAIRDEARRNLKRFKLIRTGALRRAIKSGKLVRKGRGAFLAHAVGVDKRRRESFKNKSVVPAKYAHLVEWGFTHKTGRHVPGSRFMSRAWLPRRATSEAKLRKAIRRWLGL